MPQVPLLASESERSTVEDWLRIPSEKGFELIRGRLVHGSRDILHGAAQAGLASFLWPFGGPRGVRLPEGRSKPGGWWLSMGVDMEVGDIGCRPDLVGWRRSKHAGRPAEDARGVVTVPPDFVGEVLAMSTRRYDLGPKREAYFDAGVLHYWLVDPEIRTLTLLEWTPRGYVIVRVAGPGETVSAAPFEAVEIPVSELFLDEEGELAPAPASAPPAAESAPPALAAAPPAAPATTAPKKRPSRPRAR